MIGMSCSSRSSVAPSKRSRGVVTSSWNGGYGSATSWTVRAEGLGRHTHYEQCRRWARGSRASDRQAGPLPPPSNTLGDVRTTEAGDGESAGGWGGAPPPPARGG